MDEKGRISEEHAAAVWHRAAQLQAEASRQMEDRSRAALVRADEDLQEGAAGFRVAEVRAAALEAGIAPEFVSLALAEVAAGGDAAPLPPAEDRRAARVLGTGQRSVEVMRTIPAPVGAVLEAMQRILPAAPYRLTLGETSGDPLTGGVLLFDIPRSTMMTESFAYNAAAIDVKHVRVVLRAVPGPACELSVAADLRRGVARNARYGLWSGVGSGAIGGVLGGAVGLGLLALGPLALIPAAAGAALLGTGGTAGYGALYRLYLRKFTGNLDQLARAVAADAATRGAFSPARGTQPPSAEESLAALLNSF